MPQVVPKPGAVRIEVGPATRVPDGHDACRVDAPIPQPRLYDRHPRPVNAYVRGGGRGPVRLLQHDHAQPADAATESGDRGRQRAVGREALATGSGGGAAGARRRAGGSSRDGLGPRLVPRRRQGVAAAWSSSAIPTAGERGLPPSIGLATQARRQPERGRQRTGTTPRWCAGAAGGFFR